MPANYWPRGEASLTPSPAIDVSKRNSIPDVRNVRSTLSMVVESEPDSPRSNRITALTETRDRSASCCCDHPSKPRAALTCFPEIIRRGERARKNISISSLFFFYLRNIFSHSDSPALAIDIEYGTVIRVIVPRGGVIDR